MDWKSQLKNDPIPWLLEPSEPGVRYLVLKDLCESSEEDMQNAQMEAHSSGPISLILDRMHSAGYWSEPGPGYNPKYFSTVWSLILLSQLGAQISSDIRIVQACENFLKNSLTSLGQISSSGTPSGTIDCLQGNILYAMTTLGFDDPRLEKAYDWMARSVTGDGIAPNSAKDAEVRYYAGKCGPNFACGANDKKPCAWGAIKVMLAFSVLPKERRTTQINRAIQQGVDFLFSVDPASGAYPTGYTDKPSGNWWKFGFPVFYVTDLLQIAEALVELGYGNDQRLANSIEYIRNKQDDSGRWSLEYDYNGKTWVGFGAKRQPNKWVTYRALKVLKGLNQ